MERRNRVMLFLKVQLVLGLVLAGAALAEDIVIDQDTTWVTGTYTYDNVDITNGATLTFDGKVTFNAQNITIDSNSSISANGKGYGAGSGPGAGGVGHHYRLIWHYYYGGGAGYGGNGGAGRYGATGGSSYGSLTAPFDLGSGGGCGNGGAGGGAIRLITNTLTVNGRISANGNNGSYTSYTHGAGGSGGSIYIDTSVLTGSGSVTANGGNGSPGAGGGGGGRIAVYYDTGAYTGAISAHGGSGHTGGGAGTVYVKSAAQAYGELLIDNNNVAGAVTPIGETIALEDLAVRNGAKLSVAAGTTITTPVVTVLEADLYIQGGGALDTFTIALSAGTLNADSNAVFNPASLTLESSSTLISGSGNNLTLTNLSLSSSTFINNGNLSWSTATFTGTSAITNNGQLDVPTLTVVDGLTLYQKGSLSIADDTLVIDGNGVFALDVPWEIGSATVNSGGLLTHSAGAGGFKLTAAGDIVVNEGGSISAHGRGYGPCSGPGAGATTEGPGPISCDRLYYGGGGGYGGDGGDGDNGATGGLSYGSITEPNDLGSGGGIIRNGGAGGGAIRLVAETLTINGRISADGNDGAYTYGGGWCWSWIWGGGGSGGSICITTSALTGSGSITANGGSAGGVRGGGAGGGRIAVYYDTSTHTGTVSANGGTGYQAGEDGTVLINTQLLNAASTAADLSETSSSQASFIETLIAQTGTMDNAEVRGDLVGTVNFTRFELIGVETGPFAGEGFSKGQWQAELEGLPYTGDWKGFSFLVPTEGRLYLKGVISGEISALVEGYLVESVLESGVYDQYQATWKIARLGTETVSATIDSNGILSYQDSNEYPSTELYVLQTSVEGNTLGHYTGALTMVLTHVRVASQDNPCHGEGFSIISYTSQIGRGQGWAYNSLVSPDISELSGIFSSPLLGIASGTLDESTSPRSFSITLERIDLGLPPAPDLKVRAWGPGRVSPGQTINYIIEYRNDGLKTADEVVVFQQLDRAVDFISASEGAYYNPYAHHVDWDIGVFPAKTTGYLSVRARIIWGLPGNYVIEGTTDILDIDSDCVEEGIFVNGINYDSNDKPDNNEYRDFACLDGVRWIPVYDKTSLGNLSGPIEALKADLGIPSPNNGLLDERISGYQKTVEAYSGGTTTVIRKIWENQEKPEEERLRGGTLILISPQLVTQEDLREAKKYFNKVIVFQGDDLIPDKWWAIFTWFVGGDRDQMAQKWGQEVVQKLEESYGEGRTLVSPPSHAWDMEPWGRTNHLNLVWHDRTRTPVPITPELHTETGIIVLNATTERGKPLLGHTEWIRKLLKFKQKHNKRLPMTEFELREFLIHDPKEGHSAKTTQRIAVAFEPNQKYGPEGRVLPGQRLDYKVESENEGEGIAFGVYYTDTLDEDLDDSTLEIGPVIDIGTGAIVGEPGIYNPATRTITWFVGEVGPGEKSYTEFSVNARADAPDGTEIMNFATVYFPSVPQEVRTNGIVSIVSLNRPPVADCGGPYIAQAMSWEGAVVELDGTGSADPDGDAMSYEWDLDLLVDSNGDGDPNNDMDATGANPSECLSIGQTEISLVVIDEHGARSEPDITTVTVSVVEVVIDIKPGSFPNAINMGSHGVIPVAFLTTLEFDASAIDPATVTLRGQDLSDGLVKLRGKKDAPVPMSALEDVDGDGDLDLMVHLDTEKLAEYELEAVCEIGALTYDGYVVSGSDTIQIVPQ